MFGALRKLEKLHTVLKFNYHFSDYLSELRKSRQSDPLPKIKGFSSHWKLLLAEVMKIKRTFLVLASSSMRDRPKLPS